MDLGVEHIDRSGRSPVLTEAGARLRPEARVILDRRIHLIGVAASLEAHVENRLVVAIDEQYPEPPVGAIFDDFANRYP
ncbi:LysR family transcriptional regulator, partial [Paracoccus yeei]